MQPSPQQRVTIGSWLQLADPALTEMMATAGFDWLCIDLEHTGTSISEATDMIRVSSLAGTPVYVRLSGHDPDQAKRVLDAGAVGIIVPMVNTADEAQRMVDAALYPPDGKRGVGLARAQGYGLTFDSYRDGQAKDIAVIMQIEHIDGVRNLPAILEVEGVSGFFVGPYDLSGSLGHPGDFDHPDVQQALRDMTSHISEDGPFAGIHVVEPDIAKLEAAIADGYRFIALASEMLILSNRLAEIGNGLKAIHDGT